MQYAIAIKPNAFNTFSDRVSWQGAIGGEIKQVALFRADRRQLTFELTSEHHLALMLRRDCFAERLAHDVNERWGEADLEVVLRDSIFDLLRWGVTAVALMAVLVLAEKVEVDAACAFGSLQDHAPFLPVVVAPPAVQRALEVVVIYSTTLVYLAARRDDGLYAIE